MEIRIGFELLPEDYTGVDPENEEQVRNLVVALLKGEADWPNKHAVFIQVDDGQSTCEVI